MDINELRNNIDAIDSKLLALFCERLDTVDKIAEYKRENGIEIKDGGREADILARIDSTLSADYSSAANQLYQAIFDVSRRRQRGKFGLIGGTLCHSASKELHALFGNYNYDMLECDADSAREILLSRRYNGLNVTIPHKKLACGLCDELSPAAESAGSVNTVILKNNRLYGYNTDYSGFSFLLRYNNISVRDKKVLILGSGGASQTVQAYCRDNGTDYRVISRSGEDNYNSIDRFLDYQVVINATPVGMFPNQNAAPLDISRFKSCEAVIDLIYNPLKTDLLLDAKENGIKAVGGLLMLCAQGAASSMLFTGEEISESEIIAVYNRLLLNRANIVLIGMPGCGKTTLGKKISACLGREFFDIDYGIEKAVGKSAADIITKSGEAEFRKIESTVAAEYSQLTGKVISCGGGTPLKSENRRDLSRNGIVIFLDTPPEKLETAGRPLSQGISPQELYAGRLPFYEKMYDIRIGDVHENSCR